MIKLVVIITDLSTDGRGIAKTNEHGTIFVENAIIGEEVEIKILNKKAKYSEAVVINYLKFSLYRVNPCCLVYGICGGCNFMHLDINYQREMKKKFLIYNLRRIGNWEIGDIEQAIQILKVYEVKALNYRQRITLQKHKDKVGFNKRKTNDIIDISEFNNFCFIANDKINDKLKSLKTMIKGIKNQFTKIELSVDNDVHIETYSDYRGQIFTNKKIKNKYLNINHDLIDNFKININSFIQPHESAINLYSQTLYKSIKNFMLKVNNKNTLLAYDLYAGSGTFSIIPYLVAKELGLNLRVIAVEGVIDAVETMKINYLNNKNIEVCHSDIQNFLNKKLDDQAIIVITDPSRLGMGVENVKKMLKMTNDKMAMVCYLACDVASMARDTKILLDADFRLMELYLFDTFAQTTHFETLGIFIINKLN